MVKSYSLLRVEKDTANNFKKRTERMNQQLKKLGLKKQKITQINILKMLSKKPISLSNSELIKLAKGYKL